MGLNVSQNSNSKANIEIINERLSRSDLRALCHGEKAVILPSGDPFILEESQTCSIHFRWPNLLLSPLQAVFGFS